MKKLVLSGKRIITGEGSLKALEELECDSVFMIPEVPAPQSLPSCHPSLFAPMSA